ncbi:MAG: YjbQ family protein [Planctomycetes bacterium]|nr:YjbQ family protein [Planctomycetota bacterium]
MRQFQESLEVRTRGRGLLDLTGEVQAFVSRSGVQTGLCVVFCRHTSASLLIQENSDPDVGRDLLDWLARTAPDGDPRYRHTDEGPDDLAAHLRTALLSTQESIPVRGGHLELGRWQALYLVEHRLAPHRREVVLHLTGL